MKTSNRPARYGLPVPEVPPIKLPRLAVLRDDQVVVTRHRAGGRRPEPSRPNAREEAFGLRVAALIGYLGILVGIGQASAPAAILAFVGIGIPVVVVLAVLANVVLEAERHR